MGEEKKKKNAMFNCHLKLYLNEKDKQSPERQ